jgi:hypothetical protein
MSRPQALRVESIQASTEARRSHGLLQHLYLSRRSKDEQQRFAAANPGHYSRAEQTGLLKTAGFVLKQEADVTKEFRRTQQALYDANIRHQVALRRQFGVQFDERQRDRLRNLEGIDLGVLKRAIFVAERPIPRRQRP